tara:strand:- start:7856 stop:8872 length:1017 start_codon:yes stop_codon:yes gene_type:complete
MDIKNYDPHAGGQTGAILGEPNDVYHANPAVSHSNVCLFMERRKFFEGRHVTGELPPQEETAAMAFGTAAHTLILEGQEVFNKEYSIAPNLAYRSKDDKANAVQVLNSLLVNPFPPEQVAYLAGMKKDEIEGYFAQHPGRKVISENDMELLGHLAAAIKRSPMASLLLTGGLPEVVFRTEQGDGSFAVQCRTDYLNLKGNALTNGEAYVLDLKTIADMMKWDADFKKRFYYQAYPHYTKTIEWVTEHQVKHFFWLVVEKQWPYSVLIKHGDERDWKAGLARMNMGIDDMEACYKSGNFNDPWQEIVQWNSLSAFDADREPHVGLWSEAEPQPEAATTV